MRDHIVPLRHAASTDLNLRHLNHDFGRPDGRRHLNRHVLRRKTQRHVDGNIQPLRFSRIAGHFDTRRIDFHLGADQVFTLNLQNRIAAGRHRGRRDGRDLRLHLFARPPSDG